MSRDNVTKSDEECIKRYEDWDNDALARAAQGGDRDARNALFLRNMALVRQLSGWARRAVRSAIWAGHINVPIEPNDVDQQAFLAFCAVTNAWSPERGEGFIPYLSRKLPWLLRTYIHETLAGRRGKAGAPTTPYDTLFEDQDTHTAPEPDPGEEAESRIGWSRQIESLPRQLRSLVELRYGDDLTSAQIAGRAGRTHRQVNRKLREAISIMRGSMQEDWEGV